MTTRIVSPRCSAARAEAVRRNWGTNGASDTRPTEPSVALRNERRVVDVIAFDMGWILLRELKLRRRREGVNQLYHCSMVDAAGLGAGEAREFRLRIRGQRFCQQQLRQPLDCLDRCREVERFRQGP